MDSVSFSYNGYLNAGLMHKVSVVDNVPSMQMVIIQCAVSLNKGNAYIAVPVHFIFDLPLPFIVLNTQCVRARLAALPVQHAPIPPCLLSGRVQSVDFGINSKDATEDK